MSSGWSVFVILLVVSNIAGCVWLLFWQRKKRVEKGQTLGHVFDGIEELDNPLPRWWLGIFLGTVAWGIVYLTLYPGLGAFPGLLGWTQEGQYEAEVAAAEQLYGPIFAGFAARPIPELARDEQALAVGQRLFINNCSTCHGTDGRGGSGFPDLTDGNWQWGGTPEAIKTSIRDGRQGVMPPFAAAIGGEEGVRAVTAFVRHLGGFDTDPELREAGRAKYNLVCIACHGAEGKGLQALGAPDLTDGFWLYGASEEAIAEGLWNGRHGVMPPQRDILGEERVHLLTAYVYSISGSASD